MDTDRRPIVVKGDNSVIRNETEYRVVLDSSASGNTVVSFGPVTDLGKGNKVSRIGPPKVGAVTARPGAPGISRPGAGGERKPSGKR